MANLTKLRVASRQLIRRPLSIQQPLSVATYHQTAPRCMAYKDDMDRESLNPRAHEYSNNDNAAAHSDAAFDASKTRPEESGKGGGTGEAALKGSPTDKETAEAGRGKAEDKPGQGKGEASREKSPEKRGKV